MAIRVLIHPALASPRFRLARAGTCGGAALSFLPALAGFAVSVFSCSCGSEFPFGRTMPCFFVRAVVVDSACCLRKGREAKRNGAIAVRYCLRWRVALLIVISCACGLPCLSLMTALAVCPFFGNHCAIGTLGLVNHFVGELLCLSLTFALACNQCTIPFCRKREALSRKGFHKTSRRALTR